MHLGGEFRRRDQPVTGCRDGRPAYAPVVSARGPRRARQAADRRTSDVRRGRPALRRHQRRALARPGPALAPATSSPRSTRSRASGSSTWPPAPVRRASRSPTAARSSCRATSRSACSRSASRPGRTCRSPPATAPSCPFADDTFDAVTISFGLRNIVDPLAGLRELRRVTRPGGRLVVCEFSHPTWAPFRTVYLEYLMKALPPIARAVSSAPDAYVYLAESIRAWPDQRGLADLIAERRLAAPRVAQPLRRHRRPAPRHRADRPSATVRGRPPRAI